MVKTNGNKRAARPRRGLLRAAAGLALLLLLNAPAWAQAPLLLDNASQPYNINRDILEKRRQEELMAPEPQLRDAPTIKTDEEASAQTDNEAEEETRFILNELLISGVTVFPAEELQRKFVPWVDKEVGFSDLLAIAADITHLYKEKGYITTRAVVPPQDIENGVVRIHVIEGKIGEIEIVGNQYVKTSYIQARIAQDKGDILKLQTLERDVTQLNDNSLFDRVRATVKAGKEPGTSDIELSIDDHRPYHLQLSFDNQGRSGIGLYRSGISVSHENLLGFGDNLFANVTLASRTVSTFGQYKFPLNTHGWTLGGSYAYNRVNLGMSDDPIFMTIDEIFANDPHRRRITGSSHRFSVLTEFPLYNSMPQSRRWNITGDLSLNFINSMSYLDGTSLKERSEALAPLTGVEETFPVTRTIVSGLNVDQRDKLGRTVFRGTMTNGIVAMGGNDAFIKWNAELSRIQPVYKGIVAILRGQGQFTPDLLPGVEQMQMGGAFTVRGFTEGMLIGDKGYLLSGELHFPLYGMPDALRKNWEGLVFFDHGAVFLSGADNHPKAVGAPGFLTGYGVGVRGAINQYLGARVDMGFIIHPEQDQPDLRMHFSLNSRLF